MTAPVASGWSGCRVGLAPTGKRRLVTAHTLIGHVWAATADVAVWGETASWGAVALPIVVRRALQMIERSARAAEQSCVGHAPNTEIANSLDQPEFTRAGDGLHPTRHAELRVDVLQVKLNRVFRDEQPTGHFFIRDAAGKKDQNSLLVVGQGLE